MHMCSLTVLFKGQTHTNKQKTQDVVNVSSPRSFPELLKGGSGLCLSHSKVFVCVLYVLYQCFLFVLVNCEVLTECLCVCECENIDSSVCLFVEDNLTSGMRNWLFTSFCL